jgi:hypothetical protein
LSRSSIWVALLFPRVELKRLLVVLDRQLPLAAVLVGLGKAVVRVGRIGIRLDVEPEDLHPEVEPLLAHQLVAQHVEVWLGAMLSAC